MSILGRTVLNPAGGIRYHLRAWRHSKELWAPFRHEIGQWLETTWAPRCDTLILFGPSGGYCMNWHWLRRFGRVIAVEPDPVARWIFSRQMRKESVYSDLQWVSKNLLMGGALGLQSLLSKEPKAAILFCNLIGQLPLVLSEVENQRLRKVLPELLKGRTWASFHDRLSGPVTPKTGPDPSFSRRPSDEELLERFYRNSKEATTVSGTLELLDHATDEIFPEELARRYFDWPLTPDFHHLIEGVCSP